MALVPIDVPRTQDIVETIAPGVIAFEERPSPAVLGVRPESIRRGVNPGPIVASAATASGFPAAHLGRPGASAPPRGALKIRSHLVIRGRAAALYTTLAVLWLAVNVTFWYWWLRPEHVASGWLFAAFTAAFGYQVTFLPAMYAFFTGRMRRPESRPAPPELQVALITLCVPGEESLEIIERQLRALVQVSYPHDSWVLDERGDPLVRQLAEELGVRYFSRAGLARYNKTDPPFEAKTKAGNVNAWLDSHGQRYEIFVQFDIDHIPNPEYLDRVLGYFEDERVAWVQGPSVYGNLESWVARGAAEQELILQGPLQQGFYGNSEMPFIIGSHTTYRTRAVVEIGGFQPTRAEDHLDTLVLASRGYRGVFVPEILAVGQGPESFQIYLRQQFAWASSLIRVLMDYTPRLLAHLRPAQAMQVLFTESWYPLWSMSLLALFLVPPLALATGEFPSTVPLPVFLAAWAPLSAMNLVFWLWSRRWQLPPGIKLSWRGVVLHVARWPIVFWALINVLLRVKHPYMITPKGAQDGLPAFRMSIHILYLAAVWLTSAIVWFRLHDAPPAPVGHKLHGLAYGMPGLGMLALLGASFMLAVFVTNLFTDMGELRRLGIGLRKAVILRLAPLLILAATLSVFGLAVAAVGG
jgi:cellulose synthase (UDP-forming)